MPLFPSRVFGRRVFPSRVFGGGWAGGSGGSPPPGSDHLFPEAIQAQAAGHSIKVSLFYRFEFLTATRFVWGGDGPVIRSIAGESPAETWEGLRVLGSVEGWDADINGTAPQTMFILSGVDAEILAAALADHADGEIDGQIVTRYLGFWDAEEPGLVPLDDLLFTGDRVMQRPEFMADGPTRREIRVPGETFFVQRSRAPWGMLTDRDHQARYPGDLLLERIPTLLDKSERWPRL